MYIPRKEVIAIVKQAMKVTQNDFSKQESKKHLADEANLFKIHLVNLHNKPKAVPAPKHKFLWEWPLNTGNIMEDNASAEEASTCMSDIDNQLSEVFDQGESPKYDIEKEQYLLETTGKQGSSNWSSGQNEWRMLSQTKSKEVNNQITKIELFTSSSAKAEYNSLDDYDKFPSDVSHQYLLVLYHGNDSTKTPA